MGAHAVLVVFYQKDDGEFEEACEIKRFVQGTLVHRAVAEVAQHDAIFLAVFNGPAEAHRQRNVAGNNGVPAEKIAFMVEKVHRATLAMRAAGGLAVKLGKERMNIAAAGDGVAMVAVRGNNIVVGAHRADAADGNCFLTVIKMAEAADFLLLVRLSAACFKLANQGHLLIPLENLSGGRFGFLILLDQCNHAVFLWKKQPIGRTTKVRRAVHVPQSISAVGLSPQLVLRPSVDADGPTPESAAGRKATLRITPKVYTIFSGNAIAKRGLASGGFRAMAPQWLRRLMCGRCLPMEVGSVGFRLGCHCVADINSIALNQERDGNALGRWLGVELTMNRGEKHTSSKLANRLTVMYPPEELPRQLWLQMMRTFSRMHRRIEIALDLHGLTLAQFDVLVALRGAEGLRQQDLARHLLVTKGNVCLVLDRMQANGWVERRPDPDDGRAHRLYLTPQGKALVTQAIPTQRALVQQATEQFLPSEQQLLLRLLERFEAGLIGEEATG